MARLMPNLDWLHYRVSISKILCIRKQKPRQWRRFVEFQIVDNDDKITLRGIGYDVQESESENDARRRNDTVARLYQAVTKMHTDIHDMATTSRLNDQPFQILVPPEIAYIPKERARTRRIKRKAAKDFTKDFDIRSAPEEGLPFRFALIHRATGRTIFFNLPGPPQVIPKEEIYGAANAAIEEMLNPPAAQKAREN
jgi:hypothetical protein